MKKTTSNWRYVVSQVLFIIYLFALLYLLFFSEKYGRLDEADGYRYNLVLFREIKRFYQYREQIGMKGVLINLVGNVVAFVPFGFFLPVFWSRLAGFWRMLFLTLGFSLLVEIVQLVYQVGSFDIDDLLLNTCGGVLGYLLFRLERYVRASRR